MAASGTKALWVECRGDLPPRVPPPLSPGAQPTPGGSAASIQVQQAWLASQLEKVESTADDWETESASFCFSSTPWQERTSKLAASAAAEAAEAAVALPPPPPRRRRGKPKCESVACLALKRGL